MVEYINNNNGIITEAVYPEMIQMVSVDKNKYARGHCPINNNFHH